MSASLEYSLHRFQQVFGYDLRRTGPAVRMRKSLAAITRKHKRCARPSVLRKLHITSFVSDDEGLREVDIVLASCPVQHPGPWLSALAGGPVSGVSHIGMMRTIVHRVYSRSLAGKLFDHSRMNGAECCFAVHPARDPRLVGYDDGQQSGLVDQSHRFGSPRVDDQLVVRRHVADIFVERAVTVDEYSPRRLPIADCRLPIRGHRANLNSTIGNRQSAISRALQRCLTGMRYCAEQNRSESLATSALHEIRLPPAPGLVRTHCSHA